MTRLGWVLTGVVLIAAFAGLLVGILITQKGATMDYRLMKEDEGWHEEYNGGSLDSALAIPAFVADATPEYDWQLFKEGTEDDWNFLIHKASSIDFVLTLTDSGNPTGAVTHHESWTAAKPHIRIRDAQN